MRVIIPLALFGSALLAGCASDNSVSDYALVVHDKYNHLKCNELEGQIKYQEGEYKKLADLSVKASQSTMGGMIGAGAYGPGMRDAQGQLRVLRTAYGQKNCAAELTEAAKPPAAKPKR